MKRALFMFLGLLTMLTCLAQNVKLRHDTLCIFSTWQALIIDLPDISFENPVITNHEQSNRFDFSCAAGQSKKLVNEAIKQAMAVEITSDSVNEYFVNCAWLNQNMKHGAGILERSGFLPIFFNEKMACVVLTDHFSSNSWETDVVVYTRLYHLDFEHSRVNEITPKYLIALLGRYPELRLRYEGNIQHKELDIISDFLEKYMNRIADDDSVPFIDDLLSDFH